MKRREFLEDALVGLVALFTVIIFTVAYGGFF